MTSPRAPLYVFFAAFLTFLIAFATLLTLLKPELDKRQAAKKQETSEPITAPEATASLGSAPANNVKPSADSGSKRGDSKSTSVSIEVSGKVVDPRGGIPAAAQVHVLVSSAKSKGESSTWPLLTKAVSSDGSFSFHAAIPPGGAFLLATAPGFVRSDTKNLSASSGSVDVGSIALKHGGSLRVRVSGDEAGKLAGADVTLLNRTTGPADLAPAEVSARAGDDGVAQLRGIDRGAYRVRARAEGHADGETDWRFDGSGRNGTEEVALVLLPLRAYVSGSVLDLDRTPVTKGEVVVKMAQNDPPTSQEWRGAIDSRGQFRVGPLPRGSFRFDVSAPGMVQHGDVFGESDGDPVELLVEHCSSVTGRVNSGRSALPQPPRVTVWKVDGNGRTQPLESAYRAEMLKGTSKFRVDGLGPGRYYVRAAADGFAPGRSAQFNLKAGESFGEAEVTLGVGGSLSGAVVDTRGAPSKEARVTVFEGTAPPPPALVALFPSDAHTTVSSGADGRFEFSGLSPGPLVLVVEAQGQAARTIGPLLIGNGEEVRLGKLSLGGGTILSATVANGRGQPVAFGCGLLVASDGSVRAPFMTDEDGNFCLRGLAQGDYVLSGIDGTSGRTELTLRPDETGRVQLAIGR